MGSVTVPFLEQLGFLLQTFPGILDNPLTYTGISEWNNYVFLRGKNGIAKLVSRHGGYWIVKTT
jgi:hypothetical protein